MQKFGNQTLLNKTLNGFDQTWPTPYFDAYCELSLEAER